MKRLDWNALDEAARRDALARPAQSRADELRRGVEQIIATVREHGDAALRELSAIRPLRRWTRSRWTRPSSPRPKLPLIRP